MINCVLCNTKLEWGGFAHNQDLCWDCFKKEVNTIIESIDENQSWTPEKRKDYKDILNWMMALIAEEYGYEW